MTRLQQFLLLALSLVLTTATSKAQEDFTSLFNGKDLSGWTLMGDQPASFRVEEETILCTGAGNYPNWLRSEKEYENFVLRLEFMTLGWSESGLFIHAPLYGRPSRSGIKIALRHDRIDEQARSMGSIYDVQIYHVIDATNPTGSLYGIVPASEPDARDGEWFLLQMISDGPYSCIRINGKTVAEANQLELRDKGKIVLQMHQKGARIEFLNPKVKALR